MITHLHPRGICGSIVYILKWKYWKMLILWRPPQLRFRQVNILTCLHIKKECLKPFHLKLVCFACTLYITIASFWRRDRPNIALVCISNRHQLNQTFGCSILETFLIISIKRTITIIRCKHNVILVTRPLLVLLFWFERNQNNRFWLHDLLT